MGRRRNECRSLNRIRITIGDSTDAFHLRNEMLIDRSEAVARASRLRPVAVTFLSKITESRRDLAAHSSNLHSLSPTSQVDIDLGSRVDGPVATDGAAFEDPRGAVSQSVSSSQVENDDPLGSSQEDLERWFAVADPSDLSMRWSEFGDERE
jgi:hypothetical protein